MEVKIDDSWYQVPDPVVIRMQENYTALTVANKKYDELQTKYRELSKSQHPDAGGSAEGFHQLQEAREQAIEFAKQ